MPVSDRLPRFGLLTLLLGLPLALASTAHAAPLPTGGTLLVGAAAPNVFTPLATPVTRSASDGRTVSEDGRYVAFVSEDDGLVGDDDDTAQGVYRKDRQTGEVLLVSRSTTGAPSHGTCDDPSISRDGNRVAFTCYQPLDPADDNGTWDVYVRDVAAQTTTMVSRSTTAVGDFMSSNGEISGNGNFVVFESYATNLAAGTPGGTHIFWRSLIDGTVWLVDRTNTVGVAANGISFDATISDDGSLVAFTTSSTNLTSTPDANGAMDVYLRDVSVGTTTPVSIINGNGAAMGNQSASSPAISGNGQYVTYVTTSTNDVAGDADSYPDVRRRTLSNAVVVLVSRASGVGGAKASGSSSDPQIDATGQWIAFSSSSPNLDPAGVSSTQVYLRHATGTYATELVSPGAAAGTASRWPSISADATTVAFTGTSHTTDSDPLHQAVFARDVAAHTTTLVSRPPGTDPFKNDGANASMIGPGAISADGRYAVFSSSAPALPGSSGGAAQIWRRDNLTGDVLLVSRATGSAGAAADSSAYDATISADGQRVAFASDAGNLDPASTAGTYAVYVRDLSAATTTLASRLDGPGGTPIGTFGVPFLAAGGTRVAFVATAAALGGTANPHVVVRDLATDHTIVVGGAQDAAAGTPRLDATGGRVAWVTQEGSLGSKLHRGRAAPKSSGTIQHVWWADLANGAPQQLDTGAPDDAQSDLPTLSDDGTRAAFSTAAALLPADQHPDTDVYVRDLTSGALELASPGAGGAAADSSSGGPAISGDGRSVAFLSRATNLTADTTDGSAEQVFVRELAAGTTTLASRGDGVAGALADAAVEAAAISRDGGCVLFATPAASLGTGLSPAVTRIWLRAVHGTCPLSAPAPGGTPGADAGGGATPPSGSPATTSKRPVITHFRARPARFGRRGRKAGTRLTLHVDRAATVRVVIERLVPGHRSGRRCRAGRGKRRCTVATRITTLRITAKKAGTVTLHFTAKVKGKPIARGRYRATATAKNASGTSKRLRISLRAT